MACKDCEEFYKWIVLLATKVYSNPCSYIAETELFKGIFFNRIPYLWNNLADDEVNYSGSFVLIFIKIRHLTPKCPHAPWTLTFIQVVTYLVSYSYVYVFAHIFSFLKG